MLLTDLAPAVGFGTSGVRALVSDLTAPVVAAYVRAFVRHLHQSGQITVHVKSCVVAWDLRPSSPEIVAAVCSALAEEGLQPSWAGQVPTPALALQAMALGCPGVMVTGSHIPFDRNGIKFYTAEGEILKADEAAMAALPVQNLIPTGGMIPDLAEWISKVKAKREESAAQSAYIQRYVQRFSPQALQGLRIGVYQHSAVGRDILTHLLSQLGAEVLPLGRSELFIPIDTEAVSPQDEAMAAQWCSQHRLDAVVSTDGDGDRPWVCDEQGRFMRGDVLCTLTALWLGIQTVVTPVNSNTCLEKSGLFGHVHRTRIGSPHVIEAMRSLHQQGHDSVAGFEANGGFLLQTLITGQTQQKALAALPTRDSTLPILAILAMAKERGQNLSMLPQLLPQRFTQSGRLQNLPTALSHRFIQHLTRNAIALRAFVQFANSQVESTNCTDGLRITLSNQEVVHIRPSGNAPELRCYVEASNAERAQSLLSDSLASLNYSLTQI